jgi:hypothetical protein
MATAKQCLDRSAARADQWAASERTVVEKLHDGNFEDKKWPRHRLAFKSYAFCGERLPAALPEYYVDEHLRNMAPRR